MQCFYEFCIFFQETVATLVMQLGSGNLEETDVALDVLASLVEEHLKDMVQFAIFFKVFCHCCLISKFKRSIGNLVKN